MLKYFPILFKPRPSVFKYVQTSCKPTLAVLQDFVLFPIMFKPSSPIFKCLNSVQANPGGFENLPRCSNSVQTTPLGFQIFPNSVPATPVLKDFKDFPIVFKPHTSVWKSFRILSGPTMAVLNDSQIFFILFKPSHSVQTKSFVLL